MENLELKSKSDVTKTSGNPAVLIEPLAQSYKALLTLSHDELRTAFDEYWEEHSKLLVDKFNVKLERKKGGKIDFKKAQKILESTIKANKLYKAVLVDIFTDKLDEYNDEKESVLYLESLRLSGFESDEDPVLFGIYYPSLELELLTELNFELEKPYQDNWDKVWEERCNALKRRHPITTPCEDVYVSDGMSILIDIHASSGGKPDPELSVKMEWLEVSLIESDIFKEELFKHQKGDTFDVVYEVANKDSGTKEAKAQVKIHEMNYLVYPEVDDDLMKQDKSEFETVAEYKEAEQKRYKEYLNSILKNMAADHILNQLAQGSKIPPAPLGWLNSVASRGKESHISQSGGNVDQAMKALGVTSESDMLNMFFSQANSEYIKHLSIRKYAAMFDLDVTDSDAITDDMVDRIQWRDKDAQ